MYNVYYLICVRIVKIIRSVQEFFSMLRHDRSHAENIMWHVRLWGRSAKSVAQKVASQSTSFMAVFLQSLEPSLIRIK